jgi:protein-S-isoprenylcysteine O-methyltransferase Ste14
MGYPRWMDYSAYTGIVLTVTQVVFWLVLGSGDVTWLVLAGIALLLIAVVFVVLPIVQFKRQGGVAEGESYGNTTALVDTGLYAIVRHPQYVSLPMFSLALVLIVQHWTVAALGASSIALFYLTFRRADGMDIDENIDKFGDAYREYAERVPGWNPIVGVWRLARRRTP